MHSYMSMWDCFIVIFKGNMYMYMYVNVHVG